MTLLEIMLVLAIGASLVAFGIRQYQAFRLDSDVQQLAYNVDTLFQAAAKYYYANCIRQWDPNAGYIDSGTSGAGMLDPGDSSSTSYGPGTSRPINVGTELIDRGYLNEPLIYSPLVVTTPGTFTGYFVQFNRGADVPRQISFSSATDMKTIGYVATFNIQVSVEIKNTNQVDVLLRSLKGTCRSGTPGGLCTAYPGSGGYVVFVRSPSFVVSNVSTFWGMNPTLTQFKQMYTTYPLLYLLNSDGSPDGNKQYFLCSS